MTIGRMGFCCKWISPDPLAPKANKLITEQMNQKTTTQKHLRSLSKTEQFDKVKGLVIHNCETLWRQLEWVAVLPVEMRLFRITSEFLPLFTVKEFSWIYGHYSIQDEIVERLRGVRKYADTHNIRLTMHPGQFTNLCSTNPQVIKQSLEDFEYHADLARMMGYGDEWHSSGFAINVHANIRQDPGLVNIRRIIKNDLSETAANLITLENDEYSTSVADYIDNGVHEDVALVLDVHHHWVNSKGDCIRAWEPYAQKFLDSWRGRQPLAHVSAPSQSCYGATLQTDLTNGWFPDYNKLVAQPGISSRDLRAHSYGMWNDAINTWMASWLHYADFEVEAKGKNIASRELYDWLVERKYL